MRRGRGLAARVAGNDGCSGVPAAQLHSRRPERHQHRDAQGTGVIGLAPELVAQEFLLKSRLHDEAGNHHGNAGEDGGCARRRRGGDDRQDQAGIDRVVGNAINFFLPQVICCANLSPAVPVGMGVTLII
jgi:hypothetical protein